VKPSLRSPQSPASRLLIPLFFCLASGANAAAVVQVPQPLPCIQIPPTATRCASNVWLSQCGSYWGIAQPPVDANGNLNDLTCGPLLKATLTAAGQAQPVASERVFDATTDNFTASVAPAAWAPKAYTGTQVSWANQEEKAKFDASQASIPNVLAYTRSAGVLGAPLANCEQYVYRTFYDVERWLDTTSACKGNARCIAKNSMNQMGGTGPSKAPGIGRRRLVDAEGNFIYDPNNPNNHLNVLTKTGALYDSELSSFDDDKFQLDEVPKNGFYAATKYFIVPNLIAAFDANGQQNLGALLNELGRGEQLYNIGTTSPTVGGIWYSDAKGNPHQGFADEWDFHRIMQIRTAATTEGESREYRRRQKELTSEYDKLIDAWKCLIPDATIPGGCKGLNLPNAVGKINPGDIQMWEADPLASRTIYGKLTDQQLVVPAFIGGQIGFGADLQQNTFGPISDLDVATIGTIGQQLTGGMKALPFKAHQPGILSTSSRSIGSPFSYEGADVQRAASATLASVVPVLDPATLVSQAATAGFLVNRTWEINPPRVIYSRSGAPKLDCSLPTRGAISEVGVLVDPVAGLNMDDKFHTERIWVGVCTMTNLLLAEWGRTQVGSPSCIDKNSSTCDWVPQDFVDRFVTRNVGWASAAKESEYRWCKRWTGGNNMTNLANGPYQIGVPAAQRGSGLSAFRAFLDKREANFNALFKLVPVKATDDFGTQRQDSQTIGDSTFGGGYSYDLGWHVLVQKRDANAQICRLGGRAWATLGATATLFGNTSTLLDAKANVSSNEGNLGAVIGNTHIYVIGKELFDTKDVAGATASGDINLSGNWNAYRGDGERPELFAVAFPAGPVTITITVGIFYDYGFIAQFDAGGPPSDPNDPEYCDATAPLFRAKASFTPSVDLGVWLDADASFLGFGVGLEVDLVLVGLGLPLYAEVKLGLDSSQQMAIMFQAGLDLDLTSLKGQMSVYVKAFFMKVFSVKMIDWDGFHHRFPIFRTPLVALQIGLLGPNVITPPGGAPQSETN
jgi:hypothetical protein